MSEQHHASTWEALADSRIYQDYERSFNDTTGLPLSLRPLDSWTLPHHRRRQENPFCALIASQSRSCAACLQVQQSLAIPSSLEPRTVNCPFGLSDSAIPVRIGDRLVGLLQTGQVFRKAPTQAQFERTLRQLAEWGVKLDQNALHEAYFATRVLTPRQYESVLRLLQIFAQHLAIVANQLVVRQEHTESPVITKAKQFINDHQAEDLRLSHVAKAVNSSTFYFCKMFRKATGLNFTEYLSRVRVEKAKNLLLNPNLRISEIAYEVGFQSLTHFNRVFKRVLGQSPSQYRDQLANV